MFKIPFIDLHSQRKRIGTKIEAAIHRVLEHGGFIMGPEVYELEKKLSAFCGAGQTISCANGTDALALVLMAKGIKAGDAVFVPSFTFAATAEVVAWFGATPVFIDSLPDTYNMDPSSLEQGIKVARSLGLSPKAVITVDLFGQPVDYDSIETICKAEGLWLLSDAAQSFGARYGNRKVGTIGLATTTSFYPAKPLGCYGDGGAIFTDDEELAKIIRSLRVHGQGTHKYDNERIGMNGRLDTIQAAILLEKLAVFEEELNLRQQVADRYNAALKNCVSIPTLLNQATSAWAQYTVRLQNGDRASIMQALEKIGVPTVIYYPKPLHLQPAYCQYPCAGTLTVSEALAQDVLSFPMDPYLAPEIQSYIIEGVHSVLASVSEPLAELV